MLNNYEGGNVDLRVPYIGYSSESESYTAAGIAAYHALTSHLENGESRRPGRSFVYLLPRHRRAKRLGLFFNGNNPTNLRSAYGSADFDRTHVLNFTYGLTEPSSSPLTRWWARPLNSWALHGVAIIQSGNLTASSTTRGQWAAFLQHLQRHHQPNCAADYAAGCTRKNALTGATAPSTTRPHRREQP